MDNASPATVAAGEAPKPRVLAVDDQTDSLRVIRLRLHAAGIECFTASSGQAALDFLATQPVDLVILDVMMPGMDGYEVCRRLKLNERTRDLPVLFLTANNQPEEKARGFEAGAHDYLSKPIEQQELLARARAALRVKHLQDQLKAQILEQQAQFQAQLQLQQQVGALQQGMMSAHWQKLLGQLAGSLAHEINNPLMAALGTVQLLMVEENLPEELRDRLRLTDQNLWRVGEKLRQLLLIAQPSRPRRIYLAELVDDLVALLNHDLLMRNIQLTTHLDPACEWQGTPGELARAFLYLLNNAVEAVADRPRPAINVTVEQAAGRVLLRVSDNGPGVPASLLEKIFETGFTTKGPPHSGAGLPLARAIIRAADGVIEVKSPASEAATEFTISLPVKA